MKKINKKRILLMMGSDLRNKFIFSEVLKKFKVDGIIYQERSKKKISLSKKYSNLEKKLFFRHFKERDISEKKFFQNVNLNFGNIKTISVKEKKINSQYVKNFIKKIKPSIVIVYGIGFLKKRTVSILPKNTINIHSGITPKYKGDACNFWAFYFLEPNNAGATIHFLTDKVDSGPIITQVRPKLSFGDNMHDVTNKSLLIVAKKLVKLINVLKVKKINGVLKSGGKVF